MKRIPFLLMLLIACTSEASIHMRLIGDMPSTSGMPKIPVLLVQFQDVTFSEEAPATRFTERLCGSTTQEEVENGFGTAEQYFTDQSRGLFTPEFIVLGPITLGNTYAHYGADAEGVRDANITLLINEALELYASEHPTLDWSIFDSNKDAIVDALCIIHAGEGQYARPDEPSFLWPHTSTFKDREKESIEIQGISFHSYSCCSELLHGEIDGIGVFCHEFCHQLGLPDFYRTDGLGSDEYAMGNWSLMDTGNYGMGGRRPVGLRALEKLHLGWIDAITLNEATTVENWKSTDTGASVFKIENSITNAEYYLLETIDGTGWNKSCPATGMLVTHVHLSGTDLWYSNTVNNASPYRVQIIPADNDKSYFTHDGDSTGYEENLKGDTYPSPAGNNALTDESVPAATLQVGLIRKMKKPITQIAYDEESKSISFEFMGGNSENILSSIGGTVLRKEKGTTYTADGILVKEPLKKGLYITDGKKVLIR